MTCNSGGSVIQTGVCWLLLLGSCLTSIPNGVVGQAVGSWENVFIVYLYGSEVNDNPGDPDGRGVAKLDFSYETNSILFEMYFSKIKEPLTVDLYRGDSSTSTSDACRLLGLVSTTRYVEYKSPKEGEWRLRGAAPTNISTISGILGGPQSAFIQITTSQFPDGALRGQLAVDQRGVAITFADRNLDYRP